MSIKGGSRGIMRNRGGLDAWVQAAREGGDARRTHHCSRKPNCMRLMAAAGARPKTMPACGFKASFTGRSRLVLLKKLKFSHRNWSTVFSVERGVLKLNSFQKAQSAVIQPGPRRSPGSRP